MQACRTHILAIHPPSHLACHHGLREAITDQKEYLMRMWQQLDFLALLDTLASLLLAFVLGSLVGLERQY